MRRSIPRVMAAPQARGRSLALAVALVMLVAGTALAATYPPHLSRPSASPGVVVTLGPNDGEPRGVPLAGDCAHPSARLVPRQATGAPGDVTGGEPLAGTFGQSPDGWLTFRFRVPSVAPGAYDIVLFCGTTPMTSTGAADAQGFTVLDGVPATDTAPTSLVERGAAPVPALIAVGLAWFLLGWRRPGFRRRGGAGGQS